MSRAYFYQKHGRAGASSKRERWSGVTRAWERTETWQVLDGSSVTGSTGGVFVGRPTQIAEKNLYAGGASGAARQISFSYSDGYGYNFANYVATSRPTGSVEIVRTPRAADTTNWIVGLLQNEIHAAPGVLLQNVMYGYDGRGLLTSRSAVVQPRGPIAPEGTHGVEWAYDAYGNVASRTDAKGRIEYFCYDGDTTLGPQACPAASSQTHTHLRARLDALGETTRFLRDLGTGSLTRAVEPSGKVLDVGLERFNRISTLHVTPPGEAQVLIRRFAYQDGLSAPAARPYVERFDAVGDGSEIASRTYFDGLGNVARTVREAPTEAPTGWAGRAIRRDYVGQIVRETYDLPCGDPHCSSLTGNESPATLVVHDGLGRTVSRTTPDGVEVFEYRAATRSQPVGSGTGTSFDATLAKDRNGNLTQRLTDGERAVWVDECNNTVAPGTTSLSSVSCSTPNTTFYTYEATGEISVIHDAQAVFDNSYNNPRHQLAYGYDTLGLVRWIDDPDGGLREFTYEPTGVLDTVTNGRAQTTGYDYDALDRLTLIDRPPGEKDVDLIYDPVTRKVESVDEVGGYDAFYEYDSLGRESRRVLTVEGHTLVADFATDLLGRTTDIVYPNASGTRIIYQYEGAYLRTVCESTNGSSCNGNRYVENALYDGLGRPAEIPFDAGVLEEFYDPSTYRVSQRVFTSDLGSRLLDLGYEYDFVGNIEHIDDLHQGVTPTVDATADYAYDNRNRLSSWTRQGVTRYFRYGRTANLIGRDLPDPPSSTSQNQFYADADRPHALTTRHDGLTYEYDGDGNVSRRGSQHLSYDSGDRLVCVGPSAGSCSDARFSYDVDGNRIFAETQTVSRILLGDLFEWDPNSSYAYINVVAFGQRIATKRFASGLRSAWTPAPWPLSIGPAPLAGGLAALGCVAFLGWTAGVLSHVRHRPGHALVATTVAIALVIPPRALAAPPPGSVKIRYILPDHLVFRT